MDIPDDPLERKKWMLKLWREDYGARFSVFDPEDQPAPLLESWQPDMWEQYDPVADDKGDFNPQVIRHVRWFERTKDFFQDCYGLVIGPDLFFDCKAMQCQGSFSTEIAPEKKTDMVHTSPAHWCLPLQWQIGGGVQLPIPCLPKGKMPVKSEESKSPEPSGSLSALANL